MSYYALHGSLVAKSGEGDALAKILIQASDMMTNHPTCRLYMVSQTPDNSDHIWVTEVWDSKQAHDDSLQIDGVRDLISQALPLLATPPEGGQELTVLHGI